MFRDRKYLCVLLSQNFFNVFLESSQKNKWACSKQDKSCFSLPGKQESAWSALKECYLQTLAASHSRVCLHGRSAPNHHRRGDTCPEAGRSHWNQQSECRWKPWLQLRLLEPSMWFLQQHMLVKYIVQTNHYSIGIICLDQGSYTTTMPYLDLLIESQR